MVAVEPKFRSRIWEYVLPLEVAVEPVGLLAFCRLREVVKSCEEVSLMPNVGYLDEM
jgi:hypothetical protein